MLYRSKMPQWVNCEIRQAVGVPADQFLELAGARGWMGGTVWRVQKRNGHVVAADGKWGAEQVTETPGWGQVLAVLFAQMGAVRRGRPSPRRTQHTEVAGARQGEFCRWEHGFSFPWETGSGGGLGSDGVAQPIAPRECWEWWRDKNQGDLNTQRGRAVPQPCHSVGPFLCQCPAGLASL